MTFLCSFVPLKLSLSALAALRLSLFSRCSVYGLLMRYQAAAASVASGGVGREKLSAHSVRVPPAPTTIICLTGAKSPPSQIFTGCWFHSVTVTIWSLHGGLISRTRPIRKLSASRARHVKRRQKCTRTHGQTCTHALDLWRCALMCLFRSHSVPRPVPAESLDDRRLAEGSVEWLCDCWLSVTLPAERQLAGF